MGERGIGEWGGGKLRSAFKLVLTVVGTTGCAQPDVKSPADGPEGLTPEGIPAAPLELAQTLCCASRPPQGRFDVRRVLG